MGKIFVHIGFPKTASTFLQYQVFEKLYDKGLIEFIWWKNQPKGFLQKLMNLPSWYFPFELYKNKIFSSSTKIGVLSEEAISGNFFYKTVNSKEIADKIKILFPNGRILIIIRAQTDLIISLYKQLIHQGGAMSFDEFIGWHNGTIKRSYSISDNKLLWESLKYSHLIKYYYELFGIENVKVLNFEYLKANPQGFINEITQYLELNDPVNFSHSKKSNRGYGYYQTLIARMLNPFLYSQFNQMGLLQKFPKLFSSKKLRTVLQSNAVGKTLRKPFKVSEDRKRAIRDYYKEDNQILAQELKIIQADFLPDYL